MFRFVIDDFEKVLLPKDAEYKDDVSHNVYEFLFLCDISLSNLSNSFFRKVIMDVKCDLFLVDDELHKPRFLNKLDELTKVPNGAKGDKRLPLLIHNRSELFKIIEEQKQRLKMNAALRLKPNMEIGANDAIDNNNTLLLEQKFNWSGISVDIDKSSKLSFEKNNRKSKFLLSNALEINYEKYLNEIAIENRIDYLQLDIEPQRNTFDCLKIIPFDKFKFSVITFETDVYIGSIELRDESRKYIESMGYVKVVGNICPNNDIWPFEDWYVDPKVIDPEIVNIFKQNEDFNDIAEKFMLNI